MTLPTTSWVQCLAPEPAHCHGSRRLRTHRGRPRDRPLDRDAWSRARGDPGSV